MAAAWVKGMVKGREVVGYRHRSGEDPGRHVSSQQKGMVFWHGIHAWWQAGRQVVVVARKESTAGSSRHACSAEGHCLQVSPPVPGSLPRHVLQAGMSCSSPSTQVA